VLENRFFKPDAPSLRNAPDWRGGEGVKKPHLGDFERKFPLRSSICRVLRRLSGRSCRDFAARGHIDATPAQLGIWNRRVLVLM